MKKFKFLNIVFVPCFILGLQQAVADSIDDFLNDVEDRFDEEHSRPIRYKIVSEPINLKALEDLGSYQRSDMKHVQSKVSSDLFFYKDENGKYRINGDKTNPLALAISRGKESLVFKFLEAVDDVNSEELTGWGDRQPLTLPHFALNPQYPRKENVPLIRRLRIIDALGQKGANFNKILNHGYIGVYDNPPMSSGTPSGRPFKGKKKLRARAMMYGADPFVKGSSYSGLYQYQLQSISTLALSYYAELLKAGVKPQPCKRVIELLEKVAKESKNPEYLALFPEKKAPIIAVSQPVLQPERKKAVFVVRKEERLIEPVIVVREELPLIEPQVFVVQEELPLIPLQAIVVEQVVAEGAIHIVPPLQAADPIRENEEQTLINNIAPPPVEIEQPPIAEGASSEDREQEEEVLIPLVGDNAPSQYSGVPSHFKGFGGQSVFHTPLATALFGERAEPMGHDYEQVGEDDPLMPPLEPDLPPSVDVQEKKKESGLCNIL